MCIKILIFKVFMIKYVLIVGENMKKKKNRGRFFEAFKCFMRIFKRKPEFVFLGEEFVPSAIYLSNHVGATGPLTLELYFPFENRFWGTHEMNGTMKERYIYLSHTYFHQKKHLPLWFSKFIAIFATPFMTLFYKGIRLISTYSDGRMIITVKQSLKVIKEDKESIIIFPEDSSKGYFDILKAFHPGFYAFAKKCYKDGYDLPIYLMYYQRLNKRFIVDKPIMFSKLESINKNMYEVAELYKNRANQLALLNDNTIQSEMNNKHFMER